MVDLRFDIKSLFPERVVKVSSDLLPHSFHGNRYEVTDAKIKTSEIIDTLGKLSASAQSFREPMTTHQKLRHFDDQTVYLIADPKIKPRGVVIGLLKMGKKDILLYNENGQQRKVKTPCVLDFYIHDSCQRAGLGKELFDTMLTEEKLKPNKCPIDCPSDKMIEFMKKHYGLHKTIPQPSQYLLFEGYFDDRTSDVRNRQFVQRCPVQYIAKNIPTHFNYAKFPEMAVTRYETPADHSMAEIIEQLGSTKK